MTPLSKIISEAEPRLQKQLEEIKNAASLHLIIIAALQLGRMLMVMLVEEVLADRAKQKTLWPNCPKCGLRLESKGLIGRQIESILGTIRWKRRVGRCPKGCHIGQVVPLDEELAIEANQETSLELKKAGTILAVFVPYEIAANLLKQLLGISVSSTSIWQWVQDKGKQAMTQLDKELEQMKKGINPEQEHIDENIAELPIVIGSDGVMVPFRPNGGDPKGKTSWREIKVGIIARVEKCINKVGKVVHRLRQRRLVAVLGSVDDLKPRLEIEAHRQGVKQAKVVVWLSDGARGLWRVFSESFINYGIGILDFYHAAQNLWSAASAYLDGRTSQAREWFNSFRHRLRYGDQDGVLADIASALQIDGLPKSARNRLSKLYDYLYKHKEHIQYGRFKELDLPIGSGLVESACKWLIQQRFKGVGMRWGEDGFNHLLHLRLAWVNGRFDSFFPAHNASPNL